MENKDELCKEVSKDGETLKVIAKKNYDEEWCLAILNEKGVNSNWTETFSTAQQAINAGLEAIEKEGMKEFTNSPGFGYLDNKFI